MNETVDANNLHRLLKLIMVAKAMTLEQARDFMASLSINFICSEEIGTSQALQSALLTAVNCAHRSYLGGVHVLMPAGVKSLLPHHPAETLNALIEQYGACTGESPVGSRTLFFGAKGDGVRVVCDGWRGGIAPAGEKVDFDPAVDGALGGIFAGAWAVGRCFLVDSTVAIDALDTTVGASLWRRDLHWLDTSSVGPAIQMLPKKIWLLGLGHLGQAYAWVTSFLPFADPAAFTLFLQDDDRVILANQSAGLLCDKDSVGKLKTRLCAQWLENRKFSTRIVERRFGLPFQIEEGEPRIAMCGFDNPEGRRILEKVGFDVILECGLGGDVETFDRIILHTFPQTSESAEQIWKEPARKPEFKLDADQFGIAGEEECGAMVDEIMGISVSTAFVGACAAALLWAELIRAIHGAPPLERYSLRLRSSLGAKFHFGSEALKVARNGCLRVRAT
jgi:hypothetical protein